MVSASLNVSDSMLSRVVLSHSVSLIFGYCVLAFCNFSKNSFFCDLRFSNAEVFLFNSDVLIFLSNSRVLTLLQTDVFCSNKSALAFESISNSLVLNPSSSALISPAFSLPACAICVSRSEICSCKAFFCNSSSAVSASTFDCSIPMIWFGMAFNCSSAFFSVALFMALISSAL